MSSFADNAGGRVAGKKNNLGRTEAIFEAILPLPEMAGEEIT
jgi:hypothetical protein